MDSMSNVLLITVDSLRYDIIYDDHVSTPTFKSLCDRGIDFIRAYSSGPYTRASVPAMVSGTFPWMYGGYDRLTTERPYAGEAFSQAGYTTGAFHSNPYLGTQFGYDRDFDQFFDGQSTNSLLAKARRYVSRTLSSNSLLYKTLRWLYKTGEEISGTEIGTPYVTGEELNRQILDWLAADIQPGFCWVHYMDVHHPYIPHENTASDGIDPQRAVRLRQRMIESPDNLTETDIQTLQRLYEGEVEYTDQCVEDLLDVVDETWGLDDTIIIFTSDHGEAFGEHGRYGHLDTFYDEVTRVPFAVLDPDHGSETRSDPVSGVDVLPTLLEATGVEYDRQLDGRSILEELDENRIVFTQVGQPSDGTVMAFDGTWKFIYDIAESRGELYNLGKDPTELDNLASQRTDIVERLRETIEQQLNAVKTGSSRDARDDVSPDVEERLRRLGYQD